MKSLRRFFARLLNLATGSRADQRLLEEMEEHLAQQTADNVRAGMPTAEARRQAAENPRFTPKYRKTPRPSLGGPCRKLMPSS